MSELPPPRPLNAMPGTPLDVSDVFGREAIADQAWRLLEHSSLLLSEPRRLGKTSLLTLLAEHRKPGWIVVKQSFQGVSTLEEMVAVALAGIANHQRLRTRATNAVNQYLSSVTLAGPNGFSVRLSPAFAHDPIGALIAALRDVAGKLDDDQRLLMAWDEVPDMVLAIADRDADEARDALARLRAFREEVGTSGGRLRWLLTGSVGFHHVLRGLGRNDLVNDLQHLGLGPLDAEWSAWLSHGLLLGAGKEPTDDVVAELANVSGGIPFVAHLVVARIRDHRLAAAAAGDVTRAFEAAVCDLDEGHNATAFLTRIDPYYQDEADAARWLLDHIAKVGEVTRADLYAAAGDEIDLGSDEALRALLDSLTQDHYVASPPDLAGPRRYQWRYPTLRRIWELRRR